MPVRVAHRDLPETCTNFENVTRVSAEHLDLKGVVNIKKRTHEQIILGCGAQDMGPSLELRIRKSFALGSHLVRGFCY